MAIDRDKKIQRVFPILRNANGKPRIGPEMMKNFDEASVGGILTALLPPLEIPAKDRAGIEAVVKFSLSAELPSIPIIRVLNPAEYEAERN